jgi:Tfp pilus assembly protein PilF
MSHKISAGFMLLVGTLAFTVFGCGKKKIEDKELSTEIITHRTLGLAYMEENKLTDAEREFNLLVELVPDEALGHANLGLVYLRMGQYEDSETQLLKANEIDPNDADIRLILAQLYDFTNRRDQAQKELEKTLEFAPDHVKSLYSLAQIYSQSQDEKFLGQAEELLANVVELTPGNIAARLELLVLLTKNGESNEAVLHMEEIRGQYLELPKESVEYFEQALALLTASKPQEALPPTLVFQNFLKVTPLYQAGISELKGPRGAPVGNPVITFSQDFTRRVEDQGALMAAIEFTDVTSLTGLDIIQPSPVESESSTASDAAIAIGDYDGDGHQDLYVGLSATDQTGRTNYLLRNDLGRFVDVTSSAGINHGGIDDAAIFVDFDNDGKLDLFVANQSSNLLYRNTGNGTLKDVSQESGLSESSGAAVITFVDLDHEGDLDLVLAQNSAIRIYRNNLDGSFTELAGRMGETAEKGDYRDVLFADFDEDGDIDLFAAREGASNSLYANLRSGRFEDIAPQSGIRDEHGSRSVAGGDYDNDGFMDLFLVGMERGDFSLYRNTGQGGFEKDKRSSTLFDELRSFAGVDAHFFDFNNDGFLDLLVVGMSSNHEGATEGIRLFHNDGSGRFEKSPIQFPAELTSVRRAELMDFNEDGDLDVVVAAHDGKIHLLRNDGGNANHYFNIQLVGLKAGSGKNNHFGIGAKVELRAGDLYQMRVVSSPMTHFGIGARLKADVVRIIWTNGVPQNMFFPGSDQDLIEEQTLKGSCAFLYAWNGERYEFVTDILWRSALGMPLGIMSGGSTAYAFPNSAKEHLKIPSNILREKDGKYSMQLTEELWETIYFDEFKLVVLDHPDSIAVYIDERFVPPPYPPLRIHSVANKRSPLSAMDEQGNDLLPMILNKDDVYIANLRPTRFQGLTEMHDLILHLGDLSQAKSIVLFLNGWLFPTDASINVSFSQNDDFAAISPYLQVPDASGQWKTVISNMSFPSGKNKMVVLDLSNKFLTDNFRIRIRTNMQIYWDQIFYTVDSDYGNIRKTVLEPAYANLHHRGFSRLFRKGLHGPHWFDYSEVTTNQKWRDLLGYYTRYGDVLPLLLEADDKYIIMNAGDEITVEFDAADLPKLKKGWMRDFLIYSDGWIKDGDLNTAFGKTVEPLPFHAMRKYPYDADESYPDDEEHQQYLKTYNTREVTTAKFRNELIFGTKNK